MDWYSSLVHHHTRTYADHCAIVNILPFLVSKTPILSEPS
jgi:hypothetical protein